MKKLRKRIFAAVLAALMMITAMPATALYASAETETVSDNAIGQAGTEDTEETVDGDTEETETDGAEETGDGDTEEPAQEPPAGPLEDDNADTDTGICKHHQEHDADCGYIPKSEDGEGSPCTYKCRICPVEDLIAALPDKVTEDNAEEVRAQLDEILALYRELDEDEQEQIDLSRCYALQEALDNANAPMTADGRTDQQVGDEASVTIGGETLYYATLEEAFDAANGKTATITMLTDAECIKDFAPNGSPLNINGGNVTLSLNGNTLSGKGYGYYGIIDVSGGSLLVQGEDGEVKVARRGLSCRGNGKLIVEGITLNFVGDNTVFAAAGIHNEGGTVTLNGTQMIGAASGGQIYHYSGTTTVNNVTATGATESNPKSVYYYSVGTLKINSGTFDKIAVGSGNYGGVQSVAELLGEGCAYKKQDGTWATDDELAAMEISNVTVEKIPLTINPKGDTSWFYSNQQTHTLAMNAAPVNGSDSVAYVWKNGNEMLDCTSDAYTVPADTPVGSYNYTCEATCDGYTLSHTFTVKIEKSGTEFTGGIKTYNGSEETTSFSASDTITVKAAPTATGTAPKKAAARLRSDYTAPTEGQMALFVGDVQVSEPVSAGEGGTYTMTVSASKVLLQGNAEQNGNAITLTAKFVGNDNMADAVGTVDVKISAVAMAEKGGTVIGYYGESNLADAFADANSGATVTLLDNITTSTQIDVDTENLTLDLNGKTYTYIGNTAFLVSSGSLTIKGSGAISASSFYCLAVYYGTLNIKSGSFSAKDSAVYVVSDGTLQLTGGSFTGDQSAIAYESGEVTEALANYGGADAPHYAFYQGSSPYTPSGRSLPGGTFTVKECQHKGVEVKDLGDGKHGLTCPYCGYHYEHTTTLTATASGNNVTLNGGCGTEGCGYQTTLGTASFTFPKVTYGQSGDVTCTWDGPTGYYGLIEVVVGSENQFDKNEDENIAERSWTLAQLFGNTKVTAGGHKLEVSFFSGAGERSNECELDFTIDPASLTDSMVTLSAESVTYNGQPQKPALTVKHGETSLTEGTDYEVRYTRDGVVTNDFTSAGTVKITVTGMGNYTGTVTKTFTIGEATPTITWSNTSQELTYTGNPAVITEPTVTLENNENFGGTISYSYKKQGETAYKDGLPTDAGTYMVRAHVDAAGNYAAADSTNTLTLTIKKADAVITIGTDTYHKTFGDATFTLDVTDNNTEADVRYEVTKGADVVSVENGTVTIRNAGTAAITVSLPATANYNAAENKTITVTVDKKSGYTVAALNRNYFYQDGGTDSIDLAALLPKDCGNVTYGEPAVSGKMTYSAAPAVSGGKLSYTLNSGNVNEEGTITVTVATRNFEDITVTVNVKLTDQIPVSLKTGTEVTLKNNVLTYGEPLSDLVFNEAEFVTADGKTVTGTLAWKEADATPNAGTVSAVWVFTPTENKYASLEGTAAITVNKAVPTVPAAPKVADRIYNPSVILKGDDLTSVTVTGVDGGTLEGTWGWQSADIVPAVNNSGYVAVFTPADTTNYETVSRIVTVTVEKATPYIAVLPTAAGITYGATLKGAALSGGTIQYGNGAGQAGDGAGNTVAVTGTFTWKEPSTKPVVADSNLTEYTVVFTPSDTANYDPVEAKVTLTVNKAQNAPNTPGSTMDVSNSLEKVGDVSLPEGWEWQDSDKETALEAGMAVSAVAVYAGADKGNYENETVTVAITRSACDHIEGEILYTGDGESAPTCTKEGLGHTVCTRCGAVVREYITVPALGHDYDAGEVTKEPTVEAEGERKYTCKRCGHTYTETIPRKEPQGLWIDHMQPSMNYTGAAVRQEELAVYYGTTLLREKVDYTISYKNNSNAGTAQVIVTGKGNYTGKAVETFEIRPVDIGAHPGMTAIVATAVETGKNLKPAVTVTWNGKKLKEKTDYTLSYSTSIKTAGAYEVTISGKRNYTGSMVKTFAVKPRGTKLLKNAAVSGIKKRYTYPGSGLAADLQGVVVKMGKTTLVKGTDYTVRTENTDVVGTGTVIIEAAQTDAYAGEKRIAVSITGTDLRKGSIKGVEKSYPYTGRPITPQITVYSGRNGKGEVIPADKYTVSYTNNTEKGKATVTATGIPEKGYSGSVKVSYQIGRLNLADEKAAGNLKVIMPADISHAKGGAKPQPIVTYTYESDTRTLREGADYTLKYSNHTTATGSKPPTLKITGMGNYSGSITETFVIAKQDIGRLSITVTDRAYGKNRKGSYYYSAPKVYDLDGRQLKSGRDYTVQYTYADSGKPVGKNDKIEAGTQLCAVVTAHEKSSYTGTLRAVYVVREAKAVKDIGKVKNDRIENQPYTGSAITPEVRLYTQTGKTKTYLTQESYEVIGCYNNSRRGTATILVRGKGAYSGVKRVTFKIVQKKIR